MTKENVAYEKTYQFAIRIVKAYQFLAKEKKEFVLSKQLLRSGTGYLFLKTLISWMKLLLKAFILMPTK